MYISRFIRPRKLLTSLTPIIRYFANKPCVNEVSLYLQRAKLIDSIRLALRSNSPRSVVPLLNDPALDSFVVANALRCAPSPESALSLTETLQTLPHFRHTQHTLYALAKILSKSQQIAKLKALVGAINSGKFPNVARVSFMDCMHWYAAAGDLDSVLSVWNEWRAVQKRPCIESYNIVLGLYARLGKNSEATKTFSMMIDEGVVPNSRTYTVIIEHLLSSGQFTTAIHIFNALPLMRIKRTRRQYSILVGAFTSNEQFDVVRSLLNEMQIDGIFPGHAMQSSLQRMREEGFLEGRGYFIKETSPDERIKNIEASADGDDEDEDDNDGDEVKSCIENGNVNAVRLKPWLDAAALASALHNWTGEEVSALEDANIVWTRRLVCKMIRNFKSAETAWQFFCWAATQPGFSHDVYTVSAMIGRLARCGHTDIVDQLMSKVKRGQMKLSFNTIRLVIDFYGIFCNGHAAIKCFRDVKFLCGPMSKTNLLLLYSSLLRTLDKCNMNSDALDMLDEMILGGILPDIRTFSELMHSFALQGDIKVVQRLFGMVKQSGIEPDAYMFRILIHAFCKCGRAVLALRVFEEMMNSSLMPDAATKRLLVKSLWNERKFKEAAFVEERSVVINPALPLAFGCHLNSVSSTDLTRVCNMYSDSFGENSESIDVSDL